MAAQPTPAHPATMEAQLERTTITAESLIPDPIIKTSRLLIRPMHPQDAAAMHKYASPPSITKHMSLAFAYPYTLKHAKNWIAMNVTYPLNAYVICEISHPEIAIGGIGLKPGSDVQSHTAEVGYWVGEEFSGKGYMTEALEAFTAWSFANYKNGGANGDGKLPEGAGKELTRLFAGVFSGNEGSMKCLEKSGYLKEGVLKGHVEKWGESKDLHMYGLTKKDWENRKRKKEEAK